VAALGVAAVVAAALRTGPSERTLTIGSDWIAVTAPDGGGPGRLRLTASGPIRLRTGDYVRYLPAGPVRLDARDGRSFEVRSASGTATLTLTRVP
jgi:hypothetical protein